MRQLYEPSSPDILYILVSDHTLGLKFETIHKKLKTAMEDHADLAKVLDGANRV